ncbi:hypothetical protein PA01_18905 [Azoarcus sp. PA01]|nr:hypothetical protein PA01_18905 [Azoarcus sp. PA01]
MLEVDISEALKLPGVRGIVTGDDCDTPYGVIPIAQNEFPLARGRIRYVGEPLAAVAAVDEATTDAALALIRLKVRELPAYSPRLMRARPMRCCCTTTRKATSSAKCITSFGDTAAVSRRPT